MVRERKSRVEGGGGTQWVEEAQGEGVVRAEGVVRTKGVVKLAHPDSRRGRRWG